MSENVQVIATPGHVERALDDALRMTFPASDPIAIFALVTAAQHDRLEPPARRPGDSA
jgi:hypothetical protein